MTWYDLFKALAVIQGAWCFGMSAVIMYYYIRYVKFRPLHVHVLAVVVSHNLLTAATVNTILKDKYSPSDLWFWLAGTAYLFTDISLYVVWKVQMKKRHNPGNGSR